MTGLPPTQRFVLTTVLLCCLAYPWPAAGNEAQDSGPVAVLKTEKATIGNNTDKYGVREQRWIVTIINRGKTPVDVTAWFMNSADTGNYVGQKRIYSVTPSPHPRANVKPGETRTLDGITWDAVEPDISFAYGPDQARKPPARNATAEQAPALPQAAREAGDRIVLLRGLDPASATFAKDVQALLDRHGGQAGDTTAAPKRLEVGRAIQAELQLLLEDWTRRPGLSDTHRRKGTGTLNVLLNHLDQTLELLESQVKKP